MRRIGSAYQGVGHCLLTIEETCRILNISRSTLTKIRQRGLLTPVQYGAAKRYRPEHVEAARRRGFPNLIDDVPVNS